MPDAQMKRGAAGIFSGPIGRDQARDTGMAMVLICLLAAWFTGRRGWELLAILLLVLDMTWPLAFKPLARVWLGLSHFLGTYVSKVLLGLVFFLVLTPMGLARRALGRDALKLSQWKKNDDSAFQVRDHAFGPKDLEQPF